MPEFLNGLPKDNGASDYGDSCRLAGLMATVRADQAPDMSKYVVYRDGLFLGVRFPFDDPFNKGTNNHWNFTRDQLLPLVAGLVAQYQIDVIRALVQSLIIRNWRGQNIHHWYPNEVKKLPAAADILSPSVRFALKTAADMETSIIEKAIGYSFLFLDLAWASLMPAKFEINQLYAVCYILGVEHWVKYVRGYEEKFKYYWCGWRDECWLASSIINKIKTRQINKTS